jgi:hypothetical protein
MDALAIKVYLESLPLVQALMWFIENVDGEDPARTEVFFYLRSRFRAEVQG